MRTYHYINHIGQFFMRIILILVSTLIHYHYRTGEGLYFLIYSYACIKNVSQLKVFVISYRHYYYFHNEKIHFYR